MAIAYPPPAWTNQNIVLFHGTTQDAAEEVVAGRIQVVRGREGTDFGPGFYTTTIARQAHRWALEKQERDTGPRPGAGAGRKARVVEVTLRRDDLAELEMLAFVRGDDGASDFWSFVHFCRKGARDHGRARAGALRAGLYDVVAGPVAASWNQNAAFLIADQISFHTAAAERILNGRAQRRMISE